MKPEQISVILALVRCAIACPKPSAALIHQMRRVALMLPDEYSSQVMRSIAWHENGRKKCATVVQS